MFFARAGEITADVIVRDNTGEYAGVKSAIDSPIVSPSPTPTK
jgi:hypothetical protein